MVGGSAVIAVKPGVHQSLHLKSSTPLIRHSTPARNAVVRPLSSHRPAS
jgi:hypothetical protein